MQNRAPKASGFGLFRLLFQELVSRPTLDRRPEPEATMDDQASVEGFHRAGEQYLAPVYHFNALAVSRLAPSGGTILDLGSGSGQFLVYLAESRPDVRIIGLDLSETMVKTGRHFLEEMGMSGRVELRLGDMASFLDTLPGPIDLISSVFSLHHLPDRRLLAKCLGEMKVARERFGSAIWLFDHVRPRHPGTPQIFPEVFTPKASSIFKTDSSNSLIASWSFAELTKSVDEAGLVPARHVCARLLRLYQVHWMESALRKESGHSHWVERKLPPQAAQDFQTLRWLFPETPVRPN